MHKTSGHIETDQSKSENNVTLSRVYPKAPCVPGLDVVKNKKNLELSHSAILLQDNTLIVLTLYFL